ncbi:ABC transporter ATP-binding protein [Candidatus Pacearchaeota archaeon]|nr:ABC transporter ATP-binding protein [Candidatus Pacearchaeota archaeon]
MLLEFKNVKKKYGKNVILSDINFNILSGEIFGLIGESGGGKSTLLKIIIGMSESSQGTIMFEGKNTRRKIGYLRNNTGFATQGNTLFMEMSIFENSLYFGRLYKKKKAEIKERFDMLAKLLGLSYYKNTLIRNLSGGTQKRANLLVSLIHSPKLLILDEPTAGLDPLLRKNIWAYIHEINKAGTTIIVTSHLLDEIEANCSRIGILDKGKIVAIASPKNYRKKYGTKKAFSEIFKSIVIKPEKPIVKKPEKSKLTKPEKSKDGSA